MNKWYSIISLDLFSIVLFVGLAGIVLWRWEVYECYKPYNIWLLGFSVVMLSSRVFMIVISYSHNSEYISLICAICFIFLIVPFLTIWSSIGLVWLYSSYTVGELCGHYSIERFAIPFFVFESLVHLLIYYASCYEMVRTYISLRRNARNQNLTRDSLQADINETLIINTSFSSEELTRIPSFRFIKGQVTVQQDDICSICWEPFLNHDICKTAPKCSHNYHARCLDEWLILKPTCPLCMNNIRQALLE